MHRLGLITEESGYIVADRAYRYDYSNQYLTHGHLPNPAAKSGPYIPVGMTSSHTQCQELVPSIVLNSLPNLRDCQFYFRFATFRQTHYTREDVCTSDRSDH